MKFRTSTLLLPIIIVTALAVLSCSSEATTPITTTTTTTQPPTTTTTTTTTTGPLIPEMTSLGHDYYSSAPFAICLICHDIGKVEAIPSDHTGGQPPALTSQTCMVCHKLGTVTETPPIKTEVPSEEWTEMVTHQKEGFEDCILCHGGTNKGSMIQISAQHGCTQCHFAYEEGLATGLDGLCPELTGADYWKSCTYCHQPAG